MADHKITTIVVHCSDSSFGDVPIIKHWHVDERGWRDIGYHYVITNGFPKSTSDQYNPEFNGLIQAGRNIDNDLIIEGPEIGAHAGGAINPESIGICMVGQKLFTLSQFTSLYVLCKYWILKDPSIKIIGHYEVPNSGKTCPNFDVSYFRNLIYDRDGKYLPEKYLVSVYKKEIKIDPTNPE